MVVRDDYTVIRQSNIGYHRNRKRNRKCQEAPNDLIMTLYQMASSNRVGVWRLGPRSCMSDLEVEVDFGSIISKLQNLQQFKNHGNARFSNAPLPIFFTSSFDISALSMEAQIRVSAVRKFAYSTASKDSRRSPLRIGSNFPHQLPSHCPSITYEMLTTTRTQYSTCHGTTPDASTKANITPSPLYAPFTDRHQNTAPVASKRHRVPLPRTLMGRVGTNVQGTSHVQYATSLSPPLGKWSEDDLGEELRPGPAVSCPAASYE
jgi:hypothetical protein